MGKNLGIIIGAIATFIGLFLLIGPWRWEFFIVLKGAVPAVLIFSGVIALFAGFSELKDTLKSKKKK